MSSVTETVRQYAATPRPMDPHLERVVRAKTTISHGVFVGCGAVLALPVAAILWFVLGEWPLRGLALAPVVLLPLMLLVYAWSGKRSSVAKWVRAVREAPLVVACVVQAHRHLYEHPDSVGGALFVYSLDPVRAVDLQYVEWLAGVIRSMKGQPCPGPEAEQVWRHVNNDHSAGKMQVPASIAGNGESFVEATTISGEMLPGGLLGSEGLYLFLRVDGYLERFPTPGSRYVS